VMVDSNPYSPDGGDALCVYFMIGILFGPVFLFFGYRYYKMCRFLAAFITGFYSVFHAVAQTSTETASYGMGAAAGTAIAALCTRYQGAGVFNLGMLFGAIIGVILDGFFISRIGFVLGKTNSIAIITILLLMILFGSFMLQVHKYEENPSPGHPRKLAIFACTSSIGSYLIIRGFAHFTTRYPLELSLAQRQTLPLSYYLDQIATCILMIIGFGMQYFFTHLEHCGSLFGYNHEFEENVTKEPFLNSSYRDGADVDTGQPLLPHSEAENLNGGRPLGSTFGRALNSIPVDKRCSVSHCSTDA